ncbi:MAG: ABC transporter ATP-binding protein [Butyrivibrio sp.]|jgi:ABC-2 type transport system ATP-binding protein|nr:ABC transporter ATP-binding protein [Butyrivibrio sp.]
MRPENAIEVNHITKNFKIYKDKGHTLKERALFSKRRAHEIRQVIDDISFEVKIGEAIGLIGHNGCGKSTTLKMLTKIMYPNSGSIEMRGRVSSLIELGAGFHPDMSGRENIYINASIFGLTRREIDARINDIITFSELEKYIDNPVRTYSSGMYMRLAFSVAINVNADILLIDEILAVGDASFQTKCFNKLKELKSLGTTIVIVSHSMDQIEQICDRTIWIHEGKIKAEGAPKEIDIQYLDYMATTRLGNKARDKDIILHTLGKVGDSNRRWGNQDAYFYDVVMLRDDGSDSRNFITGEKVEIKMYYKVNNPFDDAVFGIGIFRLDGTHCYGTNTTIDRLDNFSLKKDGKVSIIIESLSLLPGTYKLDTTIEYGQGIPVDYVKEVITFEVNSPFSDVGVNRLNHIWKLDDNLVEKDDCKV